MNYLTRSGKEVDLRPMWVAGRLVVGSRWKEEPSREDEREIAAMFGGDQKVLKEVIQ